MPTYINGKFASQRPTGVQRVACELVKALDACAPALCRDWVLLCPPGAAPPPLVHIQVRYIGPAGWPLHLWEQLLLPWAARGGLLLNLGGTAPWLAGRQAALLHDAAVFDWPQAYTRAFVCWYRLLFRRLARQGVALCTVSAFSRQRLALRLRLAPARLAIVPNGSDHFDAVTPDTSVLVRYGLSGQRFLLAVGSANASKNLPALVAAFARLPQAFGLCLVIVGGGNARVFAAGTARADPPGVQRTGPLPDAALKALYQHAVALVFPSLYEGFGLPPLEAMACGCPVAVAHAASLPEVCGDAALYFDPTSVPAMQAALQRLLSEPLLLAGLKERGRARAAQHRWSNAALALLQALPACDRSAP